MFRHLFPLLALPLLLAACQTSSPPKPATTVTLGPDGASTRTQPAAYLGWVDRADAAGLRYGTAPFLIPRDLAGLPISGRRQSPGHDVDGMVQYGTAGQDTWATFFIYNASAFDADLTAMTTTQSSAILSAPGRRLVIDDAVALPGGDGTPVLRRLLWQEEVGRASTLLVLSGGGWVVKLRVSGPDRAAVEKVAQAALDGLRVDAGTRPDPILASTLRPKACATPQQGPAAKRMALDMTTNIVEAATMGDGGRVWTWPPENPGDVCIELEGKTERRPFILLRRQDAQGGAIGWLAPLGDAGVALECAPGVANSLGVEGAAAKYVIRLHAPGGGEVSAAFDNLPNRDQMLDIIRGMLGAPIPMPPGA